MTQLIDGKPAKPETESEFERVWRQAQNETYQLYRELAWEERQHRLEIKYGQRNPGLYETPPEIPFAGMVAWIVGICIAASVIYAVAVVTGWLP